MDIETGDLGSLNEIVRTLFGESSQTVDIVILLTILTLLPSILMMLTGFTRIIIVLSFVRQALGMQQTPPNQILIGLALFLTFFVMQPVFAKVYDDAYIPFTEGEITQEEFIEEAMDPIRIFMHTQVFDTDLNFFANMAELVIEVNEEGEVILDSIPSSVLIPAFITSEIKHAMFIGFFIYLPFIVIDMIVASTLMSMGMMMLPPAMISLPFKVLLFVMVDGCSLSSGRLCGHSCDEIEFL